MRLARQCALSFLLSSASLSLVCPAFAKSAESHAAPEVSYEEFSKLVSSQGAVIIDANSADTYKDGHVPGAISFANNKGDLGAVLPKDKTALIVAYCGGPRCTAWEDAAAAAKKLGYTNIKHFKGGLKVWKDSGQKLDKAS